MLEVDQECINGLDTVVDFDEVLREEVANGGEVAFSHGGPEMLLEIYDFDGGGGWARGLCEGWCGEGQQEREEATHAAMGAAHAPPWEMFSWWPQVWCRICGRRRPRWPRGAGRDPLVPWFWWSHRALFLL